MGFFPKVEQFVVAQGLDLFFQGQAIKIRRKSGHRLVSLLDMVPFGSVIESMV